MRPDDPSKHTGVMTGAEGWNPSHAPNLRSPSRMLVCNTSGFTTVRKWPMGAIPWGSTNFRRFLLHLPVPEPVLSGEGLLFITQVRVFTV